jgi:MFS family permease
MVDEIRPEPGAPLTAADRWLILVTAFLGWLFGGFILSTTTLAMLPAALDLLDRTERIDLAHFQAMTRALATTRLSSAEEDQLRVWRARAQGWFAYYQCAMLFGAATGGFAFGRLGDRVGRSKAMAASILCYSIGSAMCYLAQAPWQLLILWFSACLGLGGMWPNGVALVAETWSNLSRPLVAGIMGTSANIGIFVLATIGAYVQITPEHWRWMMIVCAAPVVLGILVLVGVRESPRWLAAGGQGKDATTPVTEVFRPPLVGVTLVGLTLATIPLFGAWGSANWMVPWADEAGQRATPANPYLKAQVAQARSITGIVGSLLGGWVAHLLGRRQAYCLVSLMALVLAQYTFWFLQPTDSSFLVWVAALGFFSGIYFGWLPLCLPELFPTRARATGAGVCFHFGRVLTACTVFATGALSASFGGDYARIGRVTSLVFLLGLFVVWLAPDTGKRTLQD